MLNFLILLILMFSLVIALFNGKIDCLCNQLLDSPQKAVELTVTVGCSICLWSGVMEVARQSGLLRFLSKFFSPILSLLFPGIKKDSPAAQAVCLNLAANLLGLGAAAAPAGICAVSQFQRACLDPSVASDNSILLILLNTAAAMLRLQAGSSAPMEILPAVWMASVLSVTTGIIAAKGMAHIANAKPPSHSRIIRRENA